jgi:hypothetical protein
MPRLLKRKRVPMGRLGTGNCRPLPVPINGVQPADIQGFGQKSRPGEGAKYLREVNLIDPKRVIPELNA